MDKKRRNREGERQVCWFSELDSSFSKGLLCLRGRNKVLQFMIMKGFMTRGLHELLGRTIVGCRVCPKAVGVVLKLQGSKKTTCGFCGKI